MNEINNNQKNIFHRKRSKRHKYKVYDARYINILSN